MKKKPFLILFLIIALVISGCNKTDESNPKDTVQLIISSEEESSDENSASVDTSEIFSNRDFEIGYDESESAYIQLNGNTAACSSNAVQISGSTITIIDEGIYILSGTLDDGMIIVNSEKTDKTQLVLNGATIHSETSAPIYVLQSDKVFITTAADTTNTLSNGGTFTAIDENNIDSVIYSKEDVTLNGSGTLVVTSPAGHGIVSKDSLTITSGDYDINCASHALVGKDDVCIANGDFTIVSGKDGIHAENADDATTGFVYIKNGTYNIVSEGDGISSASYMQIEDGIFDITSGGGSANATSETSESWGNFMGGGRHQGGRMDNKMGDPMGNMKGVPSGEPMGENSNITEDVTADSASIKGIKATTTLTINGGTFTINSADDSIHSNADVTVNGGTFEIKSGDDAFHADNTLTVTAGTINIAESYEGLEGLHIAISGGDITIIASDDGLNAAGGTDSSGTTGGRDGMFGGHGMHSSSNGSITISGGNINVTAYGDGIDANGTLDITGGFTTVCGPTQGDTATLDYDSYAAISGGTFIGTGASGMAQSFSSSEQGVIAVSVGNQSAGTEIQLTDSTGNTVMTYTPDLAFSVVILSSPEIITGETYTIYVGSASGEFTAN
uniref:carbohydrate-binding domain-containing protein n=1 Tax=Agathobacter sp. TaxID=2021311 RepID=UPI004055C04B